MCEVLLVLHAPELLLEEYLVDLVLLLLECLVASVHNLLLPHHLDRLQLPQLLVQIEWLGWLLVYLLLLLLVALPQYLPVERVLVEVVRLLGGLKADELIVAESDLQVREHLVGLVDVLEFILRLPVVDRLLLVLAVEDVGVVEFGLAEELLFNLLLSGCPLHPQDLVVVLVERELQLRREQPELESQRLPALLLQD